jgi:organic radical activating enzyme
LHLNQTATEYAYYLVQNQPAEDVAQRMSRRYHVSESQAHHDYVDLTERLQVLINTPDLDPVTFLDFDRQDPHVKRISAPYRLDCAITYNLPGMTSPPDTGASELAPTERVKRELTTEEWRTVLDKAWAAGIPQVVFTGGEPTLRDDLCDLIARAEENGQISGLITDGLRFSDDAYREELLQTGLDHVMIVLQPDHPKTWEAVQESLVEDLFVAVHVTMTPDNQAEFNDLLKRLVDLGVHHVSLSANDPSLGEALAQARHQAAFMGLELVWDLPVPYSALNPVSLETAGDQVPETAGRASLYVEPDGDVLPAQGINRVLGNLLTDPWEKIWKPS